MIRKIKNWIKKLLFKKGYILMNISNIKNIKSEKHKIIIPEATYSPWLIDEEFQIIYNKIRYNTLVDIYRCYELWQLVEQSSKFKAAIIEVGVWRGGTAGLIAYKAKKSGNASTVYLVDTFQGVVKASEKDNYYKGGEHKDTSMEITENLVKGTLGLKNIKILKGIFPEETMQYIPENEKFCFCHIDVDVYQGAKEITSWIWDRMVIGGIIVFDDYGMWCTEGITKFVDEERLKPGKMVFINLNGHAVFVKTQ